MPSHVPHLLRALASAGIIAAAFCGIIVPIAVPHAVRTHLPMKKVMEGFAEVRHGRAIVSYQTSLLSDHVAVCLLPEGAISSDAPKHVQVNALPAWSAMPSEAGSQQIVGVVTIATGWPMRSHLWEYALGHSGTPHDSQGSPEVADLSSHSMTSMPTKLLWTGLAGNCVVWLLACISVGALGSRGCRHLVVAWRVRHRRCATCGYDVSHATFGVCPECGHGNA